MKNVRNAPMVGVSYRIPESVKAWINAAAAEQERSANWLVVNILSQACAKAQEQAKEGAAA